MSTVRVFVHEVWDRVEFPWDPAESVGSLKRRALTEARVDADPSEFLIKYRGAEVFDESNSLADVGVVPGSSLIALRSHRMAVR